MTEIRRGSEARRRSRAPRCPICRAPAVTEWRPFCSRRCADADLGRWLAGDYRIAGRDGDAGAATPTDGEDDGGQ